MKNNKLLKDSVSNIVSFKTKGTISNQKILLSSVVMKDITIIDLTPNTQSENSVFISPLDPDIILNSNNSLTGGTLLGANYIVSTDGGTNWVGIISGVGGNNGGDPATAIGRYDPDGDGNGRLFVNFINSAKGQSVAFSDDNGQNWSVSLVDNIPELHDKNHMWIDNKLFKEDGTSNINEGNLYVGWRPDDHHIWVSRSIDNGVNWIDLTNISLNLPVDQGGPGILDLHWGINLQTGSNGEVYAVWSTIYNFDYNVECFEDAITFAKSTNGGQTWADASHIIDNIHGILGTAFACVPALGGGKSMRTNSFPSMTVNQQNGNIFIVWANIGEPCGTTNPSNCNTGDPDIYMIKSSDQGDSWNSPIRINQDPINNGKDQWFPWIACDEVTGALVVIYYDSRNFTNNDSAETFVSISYDQGDNWEDFLISDTSWSGDEFFCCDNYAGDYIGVDVSHGKVVPVWSSDHTGNMLAYTQPFSLPCPQNLALCNATITGDAVYKVANTITVGGSGCNYTVTSTGNVIMEAGTEIIFTGDVEITGELIATINPACNSFGDARLADPDPANINETKDEPITKIEYKKRDPEIDKHYFTRFYPNPADNFTNIEYILTNNSDVNITIYNASGNLIGNIVNNTNQPKGKYQIRFDASNLAPGLYLCTITTNDYTASHKFSVLNR